MPRNPTSIVSVDLTSTLRHDVDLADFLHPLRGRALAADVDARLTLRGLPGEVVCVAAADDPATGRATVVQTSLLTAQCTTI